MASREQTDAPNSWLAAIGHRLQLDRSLVFALAAKSWQALSGPITLMLVINAFPISERGVYYGLVNIIGIQAIFELGLLNVLISQAGNEAAKIAGRKNSDEIQSTNSAELAAQRMSLLIKGSWQWFLMAAILFVLAGLGFGWISLSAVETKLNWWLPLAVVIPIAGLSIALAPAMAILEGAGHRDSIYTFRLLQIVTGSMIVWVSLLAGFKLWTIVMATAVQTLWMSYVVYVHHIDFFSRFRNLPQPNDGFSWSRDVVPMQWRVALISVAHYLASQLFVLVILGRDAAESATDAGRLGTDAHDHNSYPDVGTHLGSDKVLISCGSSRCGRARASGSNVASNSADIYCHALHGARRTDSADCTSADVRTRVGS